ncbi:MAG: TonB C-terminal domain-containing protein [Thermodesulfovibrionales bacterium]|nr:TonB C-terminal domain-containing protein [Thermodesulfovibrionales bacterium]
MLKALIYSLIFHILIISIIFFIKIPKNESNQKYISTHLVSPEELLESRNLTKKLPLPNNRLLLPSVKDKNEKSSKKKDNLFSMKPKKERKDEKEPPKHLEGSASEQGNLSKLPTIQEDSIKKEGLSGKESSSDKKNREFSKDNIFDKDIIGKLAMRDKENKPDSSITFSTKEYQYQGYMQRLKEKIEGIWKYPRDAAEKGIYGDLYIRFTIKKNGKLGSVELIRTSGYKSLDDAAMKALRDAEPYWPLPDEWGKDGLTITGHFIYTYYGSYIR